jgi:hypothetical protein
VDTALAEVAKASFFFSTRLSFGNNNHHRQAIKSSVSGLLETSIPSLIPPPLTRTKSISKFSTRPALTSITVLMAFNAWIMLSLLPKDMASSSSSLF